MDEIPRIYYDGEKLCVSGDINDYIAKRNKRIAIRRALYTLGVLIAVWGLVWITL